MDNKALGQSAIDVQWRLETWFPELDKSVLEKLKRYHELVLKYNKSLNLISVKTIPNADQIHFGDSILGARLIHAAKQPTTLFDFGSGNGFPGLVYSMLYPTTKVCLVEMDPKKCEYLKQCVNLLKIANVEVFNRKIEALEPNSIDVAMVRGFANVTKTLLITRKCIKKNGFVYHLKSEEWATEVASIPSQLCSFWLPGLLGEYKLPVGAVKYAVVSTQKIAD